MSEDNQVHSQTLCLTCGKLSAFALCEECAADLLTELRGVVPERCDFCGQPFTDGRRPIPEEAAEWSCSECVERWEQKHV